MLCVRFFEIKMIETIRKHSKWLLWLIAGATIFSMVFYMGTGSVHSGGSGEVNTNEVGGEIYGQKVTQEMYDKTRKDVDLDYLCNSGQWPEENPEVTKDAIQQRIYVRMMFIEKAKELGVHVTDEQAEKAALNFLRSPALERAFGTRDQSVPWNTFVRGALAPRQLAASDFENFVRDDLAIEQLQTIFGVPGELVTPQETTNEYIRDNQEYSAQIIFFSASNYLSRVRVTPDDVGNYYTNFMAEYRLPDRVQVSYVLFSVSNYFGEAQGEIGTSNLEMDVTNVFQKYGMTATPDAKTTNEAVADIRDYLLRRQALQDAATQADNFAQSVFSMTPVSPQNLAAAARKKGLAVEHPAPFAEDFGPSEFTAPAAFTQAAFHQLRPDAPISEPVAGPNGVYILALQTNLPSEIPPLEQIRNRVTEDLRMRVATLTAQRSGTNFAHLLPTQMAAGKSFAAVGFADGLEPLVLPPFSLSTQEVPELENHATLNQLREAVLTTPVGSASGFMEADPPNGDGGFVLYVQSRLPIDHEKMAAELPQFTAELRQSRAEQAFSDWYQYEANRELRTTPLARQMGAR
jgi:hypothetical protein